MARSKFEKRAQKRLEADGYKVDYKLRPSMPNPYYSTDYWNVFDLGAYNYVDTARFISVKGQAGVPSTHRRELERFVNSGFLVEVWQYRKLKSRDRRRFYVRAQRFVDGEWIDLFDEAAVTL